MIFDEFPLPLTFYDDKSKQNQYKENIPNVALFKLLAINDRILPFQFRTDLGLNITTLQIFDNDDNLIVTLNKNTILSEAVQGYQYFTWLSDEPFKDLSGNDLNLNCDFDYYIKVVLSSGDIIYSEVFNVIINDLNYVLLEWTHTAGDIDPVYFGSGLRLRLLCDTFITKGLPVVTLETEKDGYNNIVVITRKMVTGYDMSLNIVPNFIVEAINFMAINDVIYLSTKNRSRTGLIVNVDIDQTQVNTLAAFEVIVKFNQPRYYFSGSCPTVIRPPQLPDFIIIDRGKPVDLYDLIYSI